MLPVQTKDYLSSNQTPGTIENKNRGITNVKNGEPEKFCYYR